MCGSRRLISHVLDDVVNDRVALQELHRPQAGWYLARDGSHRRWLS